MRRLLFCCSPLRRRSRHCGAEAHVGAELGGSETEARVAAALRGAGAPGEPEGEFQRPA